MKCWVVVTQHDQLSANKGRGAGRASKTLLTKSRWNKETEKIEKLLKIFRSCFQQNLVLIGFQRRVKMSQGLRMPLRFLLEGEAFIDLTTQMRSRFRGKIFLAWDTEILGYLWSIQVETGMYGSGTESGERSRLLTCTQESLPCVDGGSHENRLPGKGPAKRQLSSQAVPTSPE